MALVLPRPSPDSAWVNCADVTPGRWLGIGTTTSSGASVEWFAREFLGRDDIEGIARMTRLAESVPPGSNRLLYVPYLQGERTPVWDPLARGVFIGLTAATSLPDLARAVFEGTAFALREVLEHGGANADAVEDIRAVGGGTQNELWNSIKAAVLRRPLRVLEFQETSAFGAALLAGMGTGVYSSPEETIWLARERCGGRTILPDPAWERHYDELFALYKQIYPRTREIMHRLGDTRQHGTSGRWPQS
ncbi:MAG: FGGY-family carbohydrate kinase [Anaerolineae bacterium]|nr:FGGY-family carbohydrate kinase [Anaerolineae bacterium]